MTETSRDRDLGRVIAVLRVMRGWEQQQLAAAMGVARSWICAIEGGKKVPSMQTLARVTAALGVPFSMVDEALSWIERFRSAVAAGAVCPAPDGVPAERASGSAVLPDFRQDMSVLLSTLLPGARLQAELRVATARREAPGLWERLRSRPAHERRERTQHQAQFRSCALVEVVCAESLKAAPDQPGQALELAELAARIAAAVPGSPGWRA